MRFPTRYLIALLLASCALAHADTPTTRPAPLLKPIPKTLADLRALQDRVESVVTRVAPTVVGIQVRGGQGSGVIVSDDGYVLTAGHVAGAPGRTVVVHLPDGSFVSATTLGVNHAADAALIKITEPPPGGKWPFSPMGHSGKLTAGAWCVAMGHPGGYKLGRTPPLRLGRLLETRGNYLRSDCTLVGGDSGGPLFDLDGNVIGIHSRIGSTVNDNVHVPVDTFRDAWQRLANSEEWGDSMFLSRKPYLGIDTDPPTCRILTVHPKSPAARAGLKVGDVVTSFDGKDVSNFAGLAFQLSTHRPGATVNVVVLRDGKPVTLSLVIGRKPRD
jgi:serine protease Do